MDVIGKNQQALTKINFFSDKVKSLSSIDDLFSELFSLVNLENFESGKSETSFQGLNEKSQKNNLDDDKTLDLTSSLAEIFYEELGINAFSEDKIVKDQNSKDINKNFFKTENISLALNQNFPRNKVKLKFNDKSFFFNEKNNEANSNFIEIKVKTASEKKFHNKDTQFKNNNLSNSIRIDDNLKVKNRKSVFEGNFDKNNIKNEINNSENLILRKFLKKNKQFSRNTNEKNTEIKKSSFSGLSTEGSMRNQINAQNLRKSLNLSESKMRFSNKNDLNVGSQRKDLQNSSYLSQETLDLMESGWGEKLAKIIKSSLQNGMNKVDIKLNPSNLGKIRLEIFAKKNSSTQINFVAETQDTANILNENLHKLEEIFENKNQKFSSFSNNGGNSFNGNKEKKKNNDEKLISLKKERKPLKITSKNIHNIDVKA